MGESTTIKGLLFHFSNADLALHMCQRAEHHDERARQKESALPELRKAVETVKASAETKTLARMSKNGGHDYNFAANEQIENLEFDIREHRNKALVFRVLAKHLVPAAIYELDESALRRLEIVK